MMVQPQTPQRACPQATPLPARWWRQASRPTHWTARSQGCAFHHPVGETGPENKAGKTDSPLTATGHLQSTAVRTRTALKGCQRSVPFHYQINRRCQQAGIRCEPGSKSPVRHTPVVRSQDTRETRRSETMRGCDLKFGKYASLAYLGLSARLYELNSSANPWQKLTLNKFCRFWRGTERT